MKTLESDTLMVPMVMLSDPENKLRVVARGVGPSGEEEALTFLDGDGSGFVTLEFTGPISEAREALRGGDAETLLMSQIARLGVGTPVFGIEAPVRWAVSRDGDRILPPSATDGLPPDSVLRQRTKFSARR